MDHEIEGSPQAWRDAGARHQKSSWRGGGVFEHADLVVGVHLAVLGFRLAEKLIDRAIGADRAAAVQHELAERWRRAHDHGLRGHWRVEGEASVGKGAGPRLRPAALAGRTGAVGAL